MAEGRVWLPTYLGLGTNLGDRLEALRSAVARLSSRDDLRLEAVSRVYETAPWGDPDQPRFFNAVAAGATPLGPFQLLRLVKSLESELGRVPGRRWGPRRIDLDILTLGDLHLRSPELNVPHVHLPERLFVLAALSDLAPDLPLSTGDTVAARRRAIEGLASGAGEELPVLVPGATLR